MDHAGASGRRDRPAFGFFRGAGACIGAQFAAQALLFAAAAFPGIAHAFHVFKVDPFCPDPSAYSTIQAAVDAAAAYSDADHADYVWISDNATINGYKNQHIVVNDSENVIIEGGFFDCTDFDPGSDFTLVSGGNADGGAVFEIVGNGNNVYLSNLLITGAARAAYASGGGIAFAGHGELDMAKSVIVSNQAGYGAGINVAGSGGNAVLKLLDSVQIDSNTAAVSGGGVRVEGNARVIVSGASTTISANTAASFGGGVEVLGPARLDVGSAGYGAGVIAGNHAANGGGIALIDIGNGEAISRIFADGSHQPSRIVNNRATFDGGAVYLEGLARACLFAPHLAGNIAEDGAAFYRNEYVTYDTGSGDNRVGGGGIYLNDATGTPGSECGPEAVSVLGGTTSCYADGCNVLSGHQTRHGDDTPSSGAMIYVVSNDLLASRVRMNGNVAGNLIRSKGGDTTALKRCLLVDNAVSGRLIDEGTDYTDGVMVVQDCTIANNTIGGAAIIDTDFGQPFTVSLYGDIFAQAEKTAVHHGVAQTFDASYIVAVDVAELPDATNPGVIQATPVFVNPGAGDYHLRVISPGVDFAPGGVYPDLDGNAAALNLMQVVDKFGASDLGAYEMLSPFSCDRSLDAVFCDGFGP